MMPNSVASQTLRVKVIESATPTKAKPASQSQERRGRPKRMRPVPATNASMSSPLKVIQCPIKPVSRVSTLTLPTMRN